MKKHLSYLIAVACFLSISQAQAAVMPADLGGYNPGAYNTTDSLNADYQRIDKSYKFYLYQDIICKKCRTDKYGIQDLLIRAYDPVVFQAFTVYQSPGRFKITQFIRQSKHAFIKIRDYEIKNN